MDDDDLDDEDSGWSLDEAVEEILAATRLEDDARAPLQECLADAGPGWFDGYIVAWWSQFDMTLDAAQALGNLVPARPGWNAVFVATTESLLPVVLDAADQASSCTVIDIAECF